MRDHQIIKLNNQIVDKDLTIRYLLAQIKRIEKELEHCIYLKDNRARIFVLQKRLARIQEYVGTFESKYNKSLSNFKKVQVVVCEGCGIVLEDKLEYCSECINKISKELYGGKDG